MTREFHTSRRGGAAKVLSIFLALMLVWAVPAQSAFAENDSDASASDFLGPVLISRDDFEAEAGEAGGEVKAGEKIEGSEVAEEEVALSLEEAADPEAAAEERATDIAELGYVPGELVVVYEDFATEAQVEDALGSIEGEETTEQVDVGVGSMATVEISDDLTVEAAAEIIEADPAVKYAVPNYLAESFDTTEAEIMGAITNLASGGAEDVDDQWHLNYVKAPQAWDELAKSGKKLPKIKVAIIDTGASLNHTDLQNVINEDQSIEVVYTNINDVSTWKSRKLRGDGYTNGGSIINDKSSHGTHVSGIVAAEANNGGVVGVASGGSTSIANSLVELLVIDAFSLYVSQGNGTYAASATLNDIMFALHYAAEQKCSIANLSLGFPTTDESLNAMLEDLTADLTQSNNMLLVAAAGNGGNETPSVPAMCSSVIAVTNLTSSSTLAKTSSRGAWCDIAAPGENILSTYLSNGTQNTYATLSGTSMASPVVVGVAAMVRAANPALNAQQVRNVLCTNVTSLSGVSGAGSGAVNAQLAVKQALALANQTVATPLALSGSNVTLSASSFVYSGSAQRPTVTVKYGTKKLTAGTDYSVTYTNSSSSAIGAYYVTVEGKGSYAGKVTKRYTINTASLSNAQITAISSQKYTGSAITPAVTVTLGGRTLTKNTDYTVAYSSNINVGTARVTVTGRGNYSGTKSTTFSITASAGWVKSGLTARYMTSSGKYAVGLTNIAGACYYFNSNGIMQTGWQTVSGKRYYFNTSNGQALRWSQKIGASWYYFNGSGVMQTGWVTWNADGSKSYFDPSTGMARTGFQAIGGKTYYFEPSTGKSLRWSQKINGKWYYFNAAYQMQTGWVTWNADGTKSYFGASGFALTGWQKISGNWYYFNPATGKSLRWSQKISNKWYYFNAQSQMVTGWVTWNADATKSYFGSDGVALTGWQVISGKRYYFDPATGRSLRWAQKISGSLYYFNSQSQMVTGWITWIADGKKSYFGADGRALTGYQRIGGITYYFDPLTCKTR